MIKNVLRRCTIYKVGISSIIILLVPMAVMVETSLAQPGRGTQSVIAQLPKAPAIEKTPVLEIRADQVKDKTSLIFYGLITEEINYSYE